MLTENLAGFGQQIKFVLGTRPLAEMGRRSGFERRRRVITTERFVTSLLHSLGTRRVESLADLHRDFSHDHDTSVNYKPYYDRLDNPGFPELMRGLFESMMTELSVDVLKPGEDSLFSRFEDVVIHDGTSFALHDGLVADFPGRFTTVSPAAVELHTTMSLRHDNLVAVTVTPDSEAERHHVPEPTALKNVLLLADRGYDSTFYMAKIEAQGGFFCIRARRCLDPIVVKIHRRGGRYRKLEGKPLNTVLKRLPKGKVQDLEVEWPSPSSTRRYFRLIVKHNGTKYGWVRLLTNLSRENFSAADVLQAYRLRWQIELLYKELKSYANLHAFSTTKPNIAEGLFWASLCVAFLKRYLAHACQQATGVPISTRRAAMASHAFLGQLLSCLRDGARRLPAILFQAFQFLERYARRSNLARERRKGRLAMGLQPAGAGS